MQELHNLSEVEDQCLTNVSFSQQFSALWTKNMILQRKSTCMNLCAILTPLCLLLLVLLFNLLAPELPAEFGNITIPPNLNPGLFYFDLSTLSLLNHDLTPLLPPRNTLISSNPGIDLSNGDLFLDHIPKQSILGHDSPSFEIVNEIQKHVMDNWAEDGSFPPLVAVHINELTTGPLPKLDVTIMYNHINTSFITTISRQATMNSLFSGFISKLSNTAVEIATSIRDFPHNGRVIVADLEGLMAPFVASVSFHLALGVLVTPLVFEKEQGLLDVCVQMGLQKRAYHAVNYLFNFVIYFLMCAILLGFSYIFNISFFVDTPLLIWIFVMFIFSFTVLVKVQLFATIFKRSKWTTFFMFIYVFLISDFASDLLMVMSPDAREDHWLTWFPSIALTKIFNIFSYHNSDGVEPLIVYDLFNNSTLFPVLFGKIIISTLILILFTVYFEVTLTHKFGRYHDWLFFLTPSFYSKKKAQNDLIDDVSAEDSTNDEVLKEAHKATTSTSLPLRVVNLKHIYPGASTPAVKGVSFTARKGEILAFNRL
ncbi:hypothetical protein RCL1_007825 [Eukaryota sp. TZLM3-RCL]